jgi:PAS domain S-box-containing protein
MSQDESDARLRALEDEVRRLSAMLENAPDFVCRVSLDGRFLYVNRLAPGFERSQVLGQPIEKFLPAEYHDRMHAAMKAARERRETHEYATLGPIRADKLGHFLTRVSPVIEDGGVSSLLMIATDVTALEESRTLLQLALNATGLGIWTYDLNSGGGSADDTTRRIFGITEADSELHVSAMLQNRIHPDDRALVADGLAQAAKRGGYGPLEHRILRSDGELRWVAASGIGVADDHGRVRVVGTVMDITHRRALEMRLLEARKLESIGRLAGGVAHDFNNMLTAIMGNLELAAGADSIEAARPLLGEVRLTAERSAALTAQLLTFARRQMIELKVLEPSALLGKLEPLLARLVGDRIKLEVRLDSRGHVRADESQLEQVVLNLITNARDNMPDGGAVRLRTRDVTIGAADARQPELPPGDYLELSVSDDGVGIAEQALPQIFEPFFTTRAGGTGLGLATCYGIVKQSGGHIAVQSELGRGATFAVYLPRLEGVASAEPARPTPTPGAARGERVLLVEDEAAVRHVVERTLLRAQYRVVTATCGEEAVAATEAEPAFDLLITDVMMPGMNGWELGERLGRRWPGLRVLYMSGYTDVADHEGAARAPFLQKPFLPGELLAAVRKLLDA